MFEYLAHNLATILVGAAVLGILALATVKLIRDRRKSSCGCGCGGCPGRSVCHRD